MRGCCKKAFGQRFRKRQKGTLVLPTRFGGMETGGRLLHCRDKKQKQKQAESCSSCMAVIHLSLLSYLCPSSSPLLLSVSSEICSEKAVHLLPSLYGREEEKEEEGEGQEKWPCSTTEACQERRRIVGWRSGRRPHACLPACLPVIQYLLPCLPAACLPSCDLSYLQKITCLASCPAFHYLIPKTYQ